MTMPTIIPGDIITSTQLPEPAKVIQVGGFAGPPKKVHYTKSSSI